MADNSTLPATGDVIASDDIAGVKWQRVKVGFGVDGTASDTSITNPFPTSSPDSTAISGSIAANGTLFSTDATGYASLVVDIDAQNAYVFFEVSVDNTSWYPVQCYPIDQELSPVEYVDSDGLILVPIIGRYVRAVVRNWTAGTVVAAGILKQVSIEGLCAANVSKALDSTHGIELRTRLVGSANKEIYQEPISGSMQVIGSAPTYRCSMNTATVGTVAGDYSCDGYASLTVSATALGSGNYVVELLMPEGWRSASGTLYSLSTNAHSTFTGIVGTTAQSQVQVPTYGASRVRIKNGAAVAGFLHFIVQLSSFPVTVAASSYTGSTSAFTASVNTLPGFTIPTQSFINSAATTNATSVKASAGTVYSITASNTGAAAAFVKFYNKASAPTVGTDVPVLTLSIPASGTVSVPLTDFGMRFGTGIALAITNLAADTDTTVIAASQVKVATSYI